MTRKSSDDISVLFARFGIDPNAYRKFDRATSAGPAPPPLTTPQNPDALPLSISREVPTPVQPVEKAVSVGLGDRWRVLRKEGSRNPEATALVELPLPRPLLFHSVVGGGGVTTILATAAKALSLTGQRVLIADGSEFSTMPFYFGGNHVISGLNTIIGPHGAPIYLRLNDGVERDSMAPSRDEAAEGWLWNTIRQLGSGIDRVLLEALPEMSPRAEQWLYGSGVSIAVVVPDMRSAVGIRRVARDFHNREERIGRPIRRYFLLNKFSPASSFDVDMRNWLAAQLGDAFLPFVLRRDEAIAEAVAEGQTVLDYAPQSAATDDFLRFVEWLREMKA